MFIIRYVLINLIQDGVKSHYVFEDIKVLDKCVLESDFNEFKFTFDIYDIKTSEKIFNLPLRVCPFGGCDT